uniref:Phage shock protein A-like n=1 Tax=Nicotiana tabacum TaxID=4097 RepID=A0A1S4BHL6_TOBAC|nr:PREDICTED: phage shock protein A-like [Nicotiana tabacum]
MLHREASSKYRAELARYEAYLKKLTEERDALKLLYAQKEEEIMRIRAELTRAHQDQTELIERLHEEAKMKEAETLGWKQNMDHLASEKDTVQAQLSSVEHQLQCVEEENLARVQNVKELETRLVAELARATSEVEALMASYRANAEAANTRAKEFSNAAEVRLSRVAEHARRQYRRETLEEVHARGFDLTTHIESAKVLEDEARALLSDDEVSVNGSESGGEEDEAPEDAAPEAD